MVPCCHSGVDGPPVHRPAAKIATGLRLDSPWSWEASAMQAWLTSLPLFWRVFGINAAVLVLAFLGLVFAPVTVSVPPTAIELVVLAAGLVFLVVIDLALLRPAFRPLDDLVET